MMRCLTMGLMAGTLVMLGTGCASIVSGTHKKVTFNSNPSGAKVTICDTKGTLVTEGVTPCTFKLLKGKPYFTPKKYVVTVSKEGYWNADQELKATLNGWYLGNLVFGGLTGLLVVDPLTGAMWTLPPVVTVNLNLNPAAVSAAPPPEVSVSMRPTQEPGK